MIAKTSSVVVSSALRGKKDLEWIDGGCTLTLPIVENNRGDIRVLAASLPVDGDKSVAHLHNILDTT